MVEISVIIPMYNASKFIKRNLDLLKKQTFNNFEVILINDGSTDNTEEIVKEYQLDCRFKYYYQSNRGVSSARNFGIDKSQGDFIVFIDADDYVGPEYLKELYEGIKNYDFVFSGYKIVRENEVEQKSISDYSVVDNQKIIQLINKDSSIFSFPWGRIFKKSIIDKNLIRFDNSIKYGEDLIFNIEYALNIESALILKNYDYYYVQTDESASGLLNSKRKMDNLLTNIEAISETYKILNNSEKNFDIVLDYLANRLFVEGSSYYRKMSLFNYDQSELNMIKSKLKKLSKEYLAYEANNISLFNRIKFLLNIYMPKIISKIMKESKKV